MCDTNKCGTNRRLWDDDQNIVTRNKALARMQPQLRTVTSRRCSGEFTETVHRTSTKPPIFSGKKEKTSTYMMVKDFVDPTIVSKVID
jgi:hypothetical protein